MSEQLTQDELQYIHDVMAGAILAPDQLGNDEEDQRLRAIAKSIVEKMAGGLQALDGQREEAAGMITETFPTRITEEEAHAWQQKGMQMMMEAAKQPLTEKDHADLSCLFVALIGGISQATGIPREHFSVTTVANVSFTALKAAMFNGRGPG